MASVKLWLVGLSGKHHVHKALKGQPDIRNNFVRKRRQDDNKFEKLLEKIKNKKRGSSLDSLRLF